MVAAVAERNALVLAHQGLAKAAALKVARDYRLPADDLCQEAFVALLVAAERYDPARGTKFSTYAVWVIRGRFKKFIEHERYESHPPGFTHLNKDRLGRPRAAYAQQPAVGLDEPLSGGGHRQDLSSDTTRGEMIPDSQPTPEEVHAHMELDHAWKLALRSASARRGRLAEALARNRASGSPRTSSEIARAFKIPRSTARDIDLEVLAQARSLL